MRLSILSFFLLLSMSLYAQNGTVRGRIIGQDKLPLPGATVRTDDGKGAISDRDGFYTLLNVAAVKVRDIVFDSQVEGMVADPLYHVLYVGEEDAGVWKVSARPDEGDEKVLLAESTEENPAISFDVEGLTLYTEGEGGYLIASSQGNFSYAVFDRLPPHSYLTSFTLQSGNQVDGVEETDGIEAISAPLGERYPMGVFIAQDGFNHDGDSLRAQNFKVVDWREIEGLLPNP